MNTTDDLTEEGRALPPQNDPQQDSSSSVDAQAAPGPSWQEQDETLRAMWMRKCGPQEIADALGRSIPAIMTRAARLGLPRRSAPGRKPGQQKAVDSQSGAARATARQKNDALASRHNADDEIPKYSERICLMCLSRFQSAGRHNRICPSCKNSSEYASASALPDIQYSTL